ncbi:MAG: rhamnan synthesis F family protein [Succinivibrio sp.]
MKKILVHVHIYYKNLYEELKECLLNLKDHDHEIFFTFVKRDLEVEKDIEKTFKNAHILEVDNLGFDVGPFVHVLNQVNLKDYSYVIKIHTKRDVPSKNPFDPYAGANWRNNLLKFIKTKRVFEKVLLNLETHPEIGMHGSNLSIFNRMSDEHRAFREFKAFLATHNLPEKKYKFVGGTMFMARAEIFELIKQIGFSQKDFESPDLSHEGCQKAHLFERFFGYLSASSGYSIVDCTYNIGYSKFLYVLLNIRKFIFSQIFMVRVTKKNKLLVKILKIPVLAIRLKKQ